MPKPVYDIDDETGGVSREQTGNIPGSVEAEHRGTGVTPINQDRPQGRLGPGEYLGGYYKDPQFSMALTPSSDPWRGLLGQPVGNRFGALNNTQDQSRLEQQRVIQDLQRQAAGDPNSLAQQQLRQGYGAARAQQSSLGSTMRGQSAGAAMRGVQQGQQGIQRGYAGDQQMLQLQEQQAAQAMLAQLLGQQQQQDIAWATGQADISNQRGGLDAAMQQFLTQTSLGLDKGERDINLDRVRTMLGLDLDQRASDRNALNNVVNATATGLGTYFTSGGQQPQTFNTDSVTGLSPSDPSEWKPYPGS